VREGQAVQQLGPNPTGNPRRDGAVPREGPGLEVRDTGRSAHAAAGARDKAYSDALGVEHGGRLRPGSILDRLASQSAPPAAPVYNAPDDTNVRVGSPTALDQVEDRLLGATSAATASSADAAAAVLDAAATAADRAGL
jgi:hypothetical protein